MITSPPFSVGAVQVTVMPSMTRVSWISVGAPGTETGVPVSGSDSVEGPAAFEAIRETVYSVPFTRPVIVQVSRTVVQVNELKPSTAVAV